MEFNQNAQNPAETLDTFANGRIGELITEVFGNDELQKRFEADPAFQAEEFEGKPSGIIALDLGIVTPEMKDALLVAQAAARTIAIMDGTMERKDLTDEVFKFVGSDRDSALLKEAQATWMSVNAFENLDIEWEMGYRHMAASYFGSAATIFRKNGFAQEADKLQALATDARPDYPTDRTPHEVIQTHINPNNDAAYNKTLQKLATLTQNQPPTGWSGDYVQDSSGNVYDPNQDDGPGGQ